MRVGDSVRIKSNGTRGVIVSCCGDGVAVRGIPGYCSGMFGFFPISDAEIVWEADDDFHQLWASHPFIHPSLSKSDLLKAAQAADEFTLALFVGNKIDRNYMPFDESVGSYGDYVSKAES